MSQHVMDRLVTILTGQLDVEETQLTADTEFEELGLDSLVLVELSVILQREFGVEVTDEELAAGRTLGSAAAVVGSRAA
ncbi:acyl carrier protein [Amycolatopsis japonica]|uniref:acyl carrier protein n=1 Tax=Amycolatopsis japonica TaxID=208439 RepID=UPI003822B1F7